MFFILLNFSHYNFMLIGHPRFLSLNSMPQMLMEDLLCAKRYDKHSAKYSLGEVSALR